MAKGQSGTVTTDIKGRILGIDESAAEIVGMARTALIEKLFFTFVAKTCWDAYTSHLIRTCTTLKKESCEIDLQKPGDGRVRVRVESLCKKGSRGTDLVTSKLTCV